MRQTKGLEIYKNGRITETQKGWIVPSQSGRGSYLVYKQGMRTVCNCLDCEIRGVKCKHQYAVDNYLEIKQDTKGNTTITKTVRMTYPQNWKAYNKAQHNEVRLFDELLKDLVKSIPEPVQTFGRPRLSLQESVFCAIQKVYSQLSSRRAWSLYLNAQERQQISKAPHSNAINKLLNREDLETILQKLLTMTALPLKGVETKFAPDSSGFSTSRFGQFAVEKYGTLRKHKWLKAHILVGTKTNVIASARITEEYGSDMKQFEPLVTEAYENGFNIEEISADMGYSGRDNHNLAKKIGSRVYIPFRKNATGKSRGSYIWNKMYHYFQFNRDEFMEHYHARSNVETTFMSIKAKFGEKLKSKNYKSQKNELLCKFIAYNIVVLIHEMFELGVSAEFSALKVSSN